MPSLFSQGTEFELLEILYGKARFSRNGTGPGDDGFIFSDAGKKWVISSDASVEKVHFNLKWCPPEIALQKAVLSNLSDINAMGSRCSLLFFNLGSGKHWGKKVFQRMGKVLKNMEKRYKFNVQGGDLVRGLNECFFSVTAMGELKGRPLLRSNAKPGQKVYVSGELGSAEAGLRILSRDKDIFNKNISSSGFAKKRLIEYFKSCYHQPQVPLTLGPLLQRCFSHLDSSSGVVS